MWYDTDMVRISKHKVKKEILLQISEKLIEQIAVVKTKKHAQHFFTELFTETERIMLAKRFATFFMLERGYSYTVIMRTLKVSRSTVARVRKNTKKGTCDFLLGQVTKRSRGRTQEFKDALGEYFEILLSPLPPRGRGRWRTVHRILDK